MSPEAHAVGVGDADARRHDVVRHSRELVDTGHLEPQSCAACAQPHLINLLGCHRAERGPRDIGQQAEDAVEVGLVRLDQPPREQV